MIPPIMSDYDCFETVVSRQVVNDLQLDTPFRNILTHDNELQLSSDKLSDVETVFNENHGNWNITKRQNFYPSLLLLGYVRLLAFGSESMDHVTLFCFNLR
jgi:hypothetical protein